MIEINWQRCKTVPRQHQKDGVIALLKRRLFMLADEVGAGKSKQVVDTAQILSEAERLIDTVLVLCPAFARGVWANPDPEMGEVAKHGWDSINNLILEYSVKNPRALKSELPARDLLWVVSNYEYIRQEPRLLPLLNFLIDKRFWLVCDEAWALKDHATEQWKAVNKIRKMASRVTLLNGTPIADTPLDLFAQMKLLDPSILGHKYFGHFRARYAILKPNMQFPLITGWQNLEELSAKVAPYILRRLTRDCFDLPPILEPVTIEAKFSDDEWRLYKQMRDDMVAWLTCPIDDNGNPVAATASMAKQAIVKGLRLAQITSGFLGGIQQMDLSDDFLNFTGEGAGPIDPGPVETKEIGRAKLDALMDWLEHQTQPERLLIWARFRPEVERTCEAFNNAAPPVGRRMLKLYGQQKPHEREAAVQLLNPAFEPDEPVGVVGSPQAGGAALNLAGASLAINLSHDFNLRVYLQARGRIDRPGQKHPIRYVDVVAVGPKGQRTIDHHVLSALRSKQDIATWTAATWRQKLLEE